MTRSLGRCSVGVVILLLVGTAAWAQATADLSGTVRDESSSVLPGVTVTMTQIDTAVTRSIVTDATGRYVLPNLPLGPYRLEASLQGFRTYVQTGLVLQVGSTPVINVVLTLGSLEGTVTVEAAAPLVDVRSSGIRDTTEQQQILALPLQGRQVTDLLLLAGAAVQTTVVGPLANNGKNVPGTVLISVAGGLPTGVSYQLDGAMHNNPFDNRNMPLPFPEALQEFEVATSGLTAEHGTHSGASVSAVTKSGTNRFHGNGFEFLRDKRFNASQAFAPVGPDGRKKDDGLKRHQVGGTLGGPVITDKLFFFGGYQGTFTRFTPADRDGRVPTAAMLAGDFTAFASPACNAGRQITLRTPFVNNRINTAQFSSAAVKIAKFLPSTDNPCGDIRFGAPQDNNEGQVVARLDYQRNANHALFGRHIFTRGTRPPAWPKSGNVLATGTGDSSQEQQAQSLVAGDTMTFGANTVNAFRVTWNQANAGYHLEPYFGPEDAGIRNFYNYVPGFMVLDVMDAFLIGARGANAYDAKTSAYQVSNDLTLVRGSHQMGVGANVAYWKHDSQDGAIGPGWWLFNGSVTGLGLADFFTGNLYHMEQGKPAKLSMDQRQAGVYGQDTWKLSNRLTLNGGVRWEPFLGPHLRNNAITRFSRDNFRQGVRSTVFRNAPAGVMYPGDPGFPSGQTLKTKWFNLAPRVGLAWDVTGDGRTAVRSSYGIAYDFMQASYLYFSVASTAPFTNRVRVFPTPGGFEDPWRDWPGQVPHPTPDSPGADAWFPSVGAFIPLDADINSTRVQS